MQKQTTNSIKLNKDVFRRSRYVLLVLVLVDVDVLVVVGASLHN